MIQKIDKKDTEKQGSTLSPETLPNLYPPPITPSSSAPLTLLIVKTQNSGKICHI